MALLDQMSILYMSPRCQEHWTHRLIRPGSSVYFSGGGDVVIESHQNHMQEERNSLPKQGSCFPSNRESLLGGQNWTGA